MSPTIAYLYPGQSLQRVGMGRDLYQRHALIREFFKRADDALDFELSRICFEGPADLLNQDLNCQLAIYVHGCAVTELLKSQGCAPAMLSGYSSGFYGAAYGAGCYEFIDGLQIVRQASEYLLSEGERLDGAMGVIFGLSAEAVQSLCDAQEDVQPAIYNTPRQIIVSGLREQVRAVMDGAMANGALDGYLLPAATAYHSKFMASAGDALLSAMDVDKLKAPQVPLISYSTLEPVADAHDLARVLAAQLSGPVRWVELIGHVSRCGIRQALEVGPGKVISRAVRWIDRSIQVLPTDDPASLDAAIKGSAALSK
ncbi:MAG: ACP S-malonyltransferase [Desulfobacteraceae bacterium]